MGYLDNSTLTVEAILTKKGREILSRGGSFNVTKFAIADDEIDYRLWNEAHPLGTQAYGSAIENLPMLEAIPDETQILKYKLVTLPKSTTRMPLLTIGFSSIALSGESDNVVVRPFTRFFAGDSLGYTVILHNSSYGFLEVIQQVDDSVVPIVPTFLRDDEREQSITAVGRTFRLIAKDISSFIRGTTTTTVNTSITIIGNQTGATITVPVRVSSIGSAN